MASSVLGTPLYVVILNLHSMLKTCNLNLTPQSIYLILQLGLFLVLKGKCFNLEKRKKHELYK
jgi:hypothetical protein